MSLVIGESELNCFQFIKKVLDELYKQLPPPPDEKDIIIQRSLDQLRYEYKNLDSGEIPDYHELSTKVAYVYCYVAAHANIVYNLLNLQDSQELARAFDRDILKISCVGGGPGSDFLGILKFMRQSNKVATLKYDIYDKEANWFESLKMWRKLMPDVYDQFQVSGRFAILDVSNLASWKIYPQLWAVDLFTISYMMSEVYSRKEEANAFFKNLFEQAKSGAFFLFVDNILVPTDEWFDDLVKEHNQFRKQGRIRLINTSEVYQSQQYSFQMESNESKEDLSPYYGRYYSHYDEILCPKLQAKVVFRICRKE